MAEIEAKEARDAADQILSKPEYQPEPEPLLARGWAWLMDQLSSLLPQTIGAAGGLVRIIVFAFIAILLGLTVWFLIKALPQRRLRNNNKAKIEISSEQRAGRKDWLNQAVKAEQAGAFGEAVRARYRALIAGLVDKDLLDDSPALTSREAEVAYTGPANSKPPMRTATTRFENIWYGGESAEMADSEQLSELDLQILSEVEISEKA